MEVLLTANGFTWDCSSMLGTVFADRPVMMEGVVSEKLRECQSLCLRVYGYNVDQTHKVDGCWYLPMIFHEDLPLWLDNDAAAIARFSSLRVKAGKVPAVPPVPGSSVRGPVLVRDEVTVLPVLTYQGDTVTGAFESFLPLVVGRLPSFVHVEMREKKFRAGLTEVPHTICCVVDRMDEQYAKCATTVTYVFAGAACIGGGHFNAIVVTAEGLLWDYDCRLHDGRLQGRTQGATVKAARGYTFSYAVYRLSSEVVVSQAKPIPALTAGTCATPRVAPAVDTTLFAGPVNDHVDVPVVIPDQSRAGAAIGHATNAQPKGETMLASPSPLGRDRAKKARKRSKKEKLPGHAGCGDNVNGGSGAPAHARKRPNKGAALSARDSQQNLDFMRAVTGDCGYTRLMASTFHGDLNSLKKDAFDLAARVLHYQTLTGHPVHGPGRATMFYHKYSGTGTGSACVAPVSPVAKEVRFCQIHDRLLQFATRGPLQDAIVQGVAEIVQSGYLIENVVCKVTRSTSAINHEAVSRYIRVDGETSYMRDRSELGWVRALEKASSGNATYSWPRDGMVNDKPHPGGLCHVDTHGRLDEGMVVVMLLLTPHGGKSYCR